MKHRILALLIAAVMVLCLFSGCGQQETTAAVEETTAAVEETAAAVEETAEAPAQAPEAAETEPAAAEEAPAEVPAEPAYSVSYPLEEGSEISTWQAFDANAFSQAIESYDDLPTLGYIKEQTGVDLIIVEATGTDGGTEQYNLMIAAGDYCDIMPTSNYTGGAVQAFADDVIIDMTDLLEEYAPDFYARLMTYSEAERYEATSDGMFLAMPNFIETAIVDSGAFTRADWLADLNLDAPTTFSELENMLYTMHDTYHTEWTVHMESGCSMDFANSWFDTGIFTVGGSDIAAYLDHDGTVRSALNSDGYRAYLEWLIQLYQDSILNQDFYVSSLGPQAGVYIGEGQMAYWTAMADHMTSYWEYNTDDEDFDILPLARITGDNGEDYATFRNPIELDSRGGNPSISCDCEDVELAMNFMNWFYTEDGIEFSNYGEEGVAYSFDEDGNRVYSDVIINNPSGCNSLTAFKIWGWNLTGSVYSEERYIETYTEVVANAISVWSDLTGADYSQSIPTGAGLSTEESESINDYISDLTTAASEQILKWITGQEELTDSAWADYCARMEALGLNECVAAYQQAYDDYAAEFLN